MIVVDTNIIAYLYISGEHAQQAELLLLTDQDWNVPVLWRSEFRSVLSQYLRKNILTIEEVLLILQQAEKLLSDNEFTVSSAQVMQLVKTSRCSAYDCEYVALAKYLNIPLITADNEILSEFPDLSVSMDTYLA